MLVGLLIAAAGCTSAAGGTVTPTAGPAATGPTGVPRPDHVVVVMLENKDSSSILGSDQAPYLNSLAARSAVFTDSHAITHPSQPNYLAVFSGDTQGVTNDDCPQTFSSPNLGSELTNAALSFGGFSEDIPATGYLGCTAGGYARKHNPWVDFTNLPGSVNRPYSEFGGNYAALPTVSFAIPNLCNDMHDCSVRTGDDWLRTNVQPYLDWASSHNSLLVITFDENDGSAGNQIATLFAGPMVRPGSYAEPVDHYRVLRTLEDAYRLTHAGHSAASTPISDVWTTG